MSQNQGSQSSSTFKLMGSKDDSGEPLRYAMPYINQQPVNNLIKMFFDELVADVSNALKDFK